MVKAGKAVVGKAILTCSYNDSGPGLEKKIEEDYRREKAAGKTSLNHLILRNSQSGYDSLKFNLLLGGIPLFLYTLYAMHKAGVEKVAVVGNHETGRIHQAFCEHFNIKGYDFVHEGKPDEWSLSNTIRKGKECLKPSSDELVLVCPGDAPFISIQELVQSPYAASHDFIAPFNSKTYCGSYYPRNFHYVLVDEQGIKYPAKEATAMLINFSKLDQNRFGQELYDRVFGARKSYEKGNPQQKFIADLLFKEQGKLSLERGMRTISSIGLSHFMREAFRYASRRALGQKENERNAPHISIKSVERLIEHSLSIPDFHAKVFPTQDPAAMLDIDSFEDVMFAESMLRQSDEPDDIYPYYDELKSLCKAQVSKGFGCDFPERWHKYANAQLYNHGIKAFYLSDGRFEQELFSPERIKGEIGLIRDFQGGLRRSDS